MEKSKKVEITADREICATRLLDAPRELVWKMFTNPQHIAQWWGPNGFTNTIHQMDVRPGGVWDFIMHGPDGTNYKNKNVFVEVVAPEKISYDHVSVPKHHVEITLEALGKKTKLTFRMTFDTAEERDAVATKFGAVEGLSQTLGRLQQKVEEVASSLPKELVVMRTFQAPRALVFKAWTDPKHVAQWWGPRGFTNPVCNWDARPGGLIYVEMRFPDGTPHPMKGAFREVIEPSRLVFTTTAFEDEKGNPQLENLNTVTFEEVNGVTEQKLHVIVLRSSPEIAHALAGMSIGWNQTLDKLIEHVAKVQTR